MKIKRIEERSLIYRFILFGLLTCFLVLLASSCKKIEEAEEDQLAQITQSFKQKLGELHEKFSFPGATAAFVLPDGRFSSVAVGYSDLENQTLMKPTDRMSAGSVGKTFVSALSILLDQEAKLGLDDKIEKWLGKEEWFSRLPNGRDITIRLLLNHRSGLKDHAFESKKWAQDIVQILNSNPDAIISPAKIVSYILDVDPLFEAGEDFHYSDTNYIIVGIIIEKATQSTYYDELGTRILHRFGLNNTLPAIRREIPGIVPGYIDPQNPFGLAVKKTVEEGIMLFSPQSEWTGGGLVSTSEDLARWAKLLYEGKLTEKPYLNELLEHDGFEYGLGVGVRDTELGLTCGHSGYFPGYNTSMAYFVGPKISVAIQVNRDHNNGDLRAHVVELAKAIIQEQSNSQL